jgi:DNA-binding CsgD family transcriptional regulator
MKLIQYLSDLLFRYQKTLEALAIFLLFLTVSFSTDYSGTKWLWNKYPFIAFILVIIIVIIALVWIQIEKNKTRNVINSIKATFSNNKSLEENRLDELSTRQKEVFELISSGKTNKEIMEQLSIELSTLKTHINKIYKILQVDSRKQLKKFKTTL